MASTLHISQAVKRRRYDAAFKAEALRLAQESHSARMAAQQFGGSEMLLCRWPQARAEMDAGSTAQAQWRALQAENQRSEREVAVLKKALAIFSRGPP